MSTALVELAMRMFPLVSVSGYEWLSREVEAYPSKFTTPTVVASLVKQVSITPVREAKMYLVESCSAEERVFMGES
ncbi:hypothetical protein CR513_50912, partial [Mucuna pruriens]